MVQDKDEPDEEAPLDAGNDTEQPQPRGESKSVSEEVMHIRMATPSRTHLLASLASTVPIVHIGLAPLSRIPIIMLSTGWR